MVLSKYTWVAPKTDWKVTYDESGNYAGDYFEPADYNRIKNNINYLYDYAKQMFDNDPDIYDLGEDVYYGSTNEPKASWWTMLQDNLQMINDSSITIDIGEREVYYSNTAGRLLEELIRIEKATLDIYNKFNSINENKVRLSFRLGNRKGVKC